MPTFMLGQVFPEQSISGRRTVSKEKNRCSGCAIETGDLIKTSKKMWEGLAAFKFMWFNFLLDQRGEVIRFSEGESFANVLADLALRVILSEDKATLEKLILIRTGFKKDENSKIIGVESEYPVPLLENKEKASQDYEEILNIILTYQERVPEWRDK